MKPGITEPDLHDCNEFFSVIVENSAAEAEVRAALAAAGLEVAGLYGCTTDGIPRRPVDEDVHTKAIYVARRRPVGPTPRPWRGA